MVLAGRVGKKRVEMQQKPLPRWATFRPHNTKKHKRDSEEDEEDSRKEGSISREDCYLREKAFHCLSSLIDNALEATFDDSLVTKEECFSNDGDGDDGDNSCGTGGVLDEIISFVTQFQPLKNELLLSDDDDDDDMNEAIDPPSVKKICNEEESKKPSTGTVNVLRSWLTSRRYHPTILPLIIIHCTPSVLDRRELVQSLQRGLMCSHEEHDADRLTKRRRYHRHGGEFKSAICTIRSHANGGKGRKKSKDLSDYLCDILTQCINQEQNPSQYKYLLDRQCCSLKLSADPHLGSRRTPMPYKDRLLEWCTSTTCFNSVLVIIENPEIMPILSTDAFIGTISTLRSHSGVPISLALLSISEDLQQNRLSLLSTHSIDGEAGVQVRDFHTPSSAAILDRLLEKFYSTIGGPFNLPVILSPPVLRKMRASFHDNHGSVVTFVQETKMALAHHFSTEGSFLAVVQNKSFISHFGRRVAWFCVAQTPREQRIKRVLTKSNANVNAKVLLETLQTAVEERNLLSLISNFVDIARRRISNLRMESDQKKPFGVYNNAERCITMSIDYKDTLESIFESFRTVALSDLLSLFLEWMAQADQHIDICRRTDVSAVLCSHIGGDYANIDHLRDAFEGIESLRVFLTESIVLIGALIEAQIDKTIGNIEKDFRESLVARFEVTFRRITFSSCAVFGKNQKTELDPFFDSLFAEPRRFISSTIASPKALEHGVHEHAADVQAAFKCFDTRIISKDDWFQLFVTNFPDFEEKALTNELLQRFAFAVYELVLCGLISRSGGRDSFEKKAMVWAALP